MQRIISCLLFGFILTIQSSAVEAASAGRWHVPGTICQYFGYGFGPGHHAPMIRYPGYHAESPPRTVIASPHCYPRSGSAYRYPAAARPMTSGGCCQAPSPAVDQARFSTAGIPPYRHPTPIYAR